MKVYVSFKQKEKGEREPGQGLPPPYGGKMGLFNMCLYRAPCEVRDRSYVSGHWVKP